MNKQYGFVSAGRVKWGTAAIRDGGGEAGVRVRASQEKDRNFPKFSGLLVAYIYLT